jgi:hypothetical protein
MQVTNKKACQFIGWERKVQSDDKGTGHCGFCPGAHENYLWSKSHLIAGQFYVDERAAGKTVKLAGRAATKLHEALQRFPEADQLTIVTLDNGSSATLPTRDLDLSTGFISGGYVRTALTVDVRNLRLRLRRAIEADAAIIGADDE